MRLLALAATNSWQGRIAGSRNCRGTWGGGHSQFSFNNDAFLYETASNFQISQSKNG